MDYALMISRLEEAMGNGELRVRWEDRFIEYRSISEMIEAISYFKEKLKAEDAKTTGGQKPRQVRINGHSAWNSRYRR